jgi:hypothetical protein
LCVSWDIRQYVPRDNSARDPDDAALDGQGQRARLVLLEVLLAGLAVAAALTLGIEIRARRKVVATLRGGE